MERTILHCDCNGFYASVECILRPELKNVPMAVGGDPQQRHGIILAKNELAKKYDVRTAETIWQAKRKCPDLVLVQPHREMYAEYSRKINQIYGQYTDLVEPFGIDESWLDVTGTTHLFGDGVKIADTLRRRVREELGLTISAGVSFNKVYAKLGSDYKKPDATTLICRENYKEIVFPLPVDALLYVGRRAKEMMESIGIYTIGELAQSDKKQMVALLGKTGGILHDYACGLDDSPVAPADAPREIKSVGNGMTFRRNLLGMDDIKSGIAALSDTVASRMRKYGVKCSTVQVTIKDTNLRVITRQKPLERPSNLAKELEKASLELIKASWNLKAPIRMLTVTGLNLCDAAAGAEQLCLFGQEQAERRRKQESLEKTMDSIRQKYGKNAIANAAALGGAFAEGECQAIEEEDI